MAVHIGYDERLAHLIHGGSDAIIQPSRFEPCGLTQLYGLRYGAVPIVSRTGGLAEKPSSTPTMRAMGAGVATGFQFHPITTEGLRHGVRRAIEVFQLPEQWQRLQNQGMTARFRGSAAPVSTQCSTAACWMKPKVATTISRAGPPADPTFQPI